MHHDTPPATAPVRPSRHHLLTLAAPVLVALAGGVVLIAPPPAWGQAAAASASVTAAVSSRPDDELAAAFDRFDQAGAANPAAVDDAAERFARLSAARPADPVLRAYAGATTSMRAVTTMLPWRKMTYAEDGLALVDKALAQLGSAHEQALHRGVPAVLETRFVAANTFLGLPAMFNRAERGRQQLDQVLGSPLLDSAPLRFRAVVWLRAARLAEDDKQPERARQWYERVVASNAPQATAARDRLKGL